MNLCNVSAIVAIFNGGELLKNSIDSLSQQDVAGMEIILIDDGSSDSSWNLIQSYLDKRIRAFHHSNVGLAATLNRGIFIAKGRFIARHDQDDLVLNGRLSIQMAYLEANSDCALCGTWAQIYSGDTPTARYHRHPASNEALKLELLFDNPFVHSSMMIRTEILQRIGGYCEDKARQPPEDYELWSRIARHYRIANIPEVLTIYREVPGSMSRMGESPFLGNVMRISAENIFHILSFRYSMDECNALAELYHIGGRVGYRSALTKVKALEMLDLAAKRIAGDRKSWSKEFEDVYVRMRTHIRARFFRRLIPNRLLIPARWLRDKILRMSLPK
jgi:glycosyltransferase involved in cell wall biosynthesis